MSPDADLTGVLRETILFLECLREVKLPVSLESIRENLLIRSKDTLASLAVERIAEQSSPEAYLNMHVGTKGLLSASGGDTELQEYVGVEQPTRKHQDYYETFQETTVDPAESTRSTDDSSAPSSIAIDQRYDQRCDQPAEDTLLRVYTNLSAAQTRDKCLKCGPLLRKEGKKLFVFEQYRACWIGLVGSYLLIYGNDRESRPCAMQSIHGYMARPAPNVVPRDQRRAESAFEIFRPGSRTLQFVARTPKDMEQWVAKIREIGCAGKDLASPRLDERVPNSSVPTSAAGGLLEVSASKSEGRDEPRRRPNDRRDDTELPAPEINGQQASDGPPAIPENPSSRDLPPLPARIPRRLPSLPSTKPTASYRLQPEDEEDDIYHKIDDFRGSGCYQNITTPAAGKTNEIGLAELPTYDDVRASTTANETRASRSENPSTPTHRPNKPDEKTPNESSKNETYDDVANAINRNGKTISADHRRTIVVSYDDVEHLLPKGRSPKERSTAATNTEESSKSPHKRSFLDRVKSRKGSPRKHDKTSTAIASTATTSPNNPRLSTYDDASDLTGARGNGSFDQEIPEYNFPPPPRQVSAISSSITTPRIATESQELYDDVASCRETYKDERVEIKATQRTLGIQNIRESTCLENEEIIESVNTEQRHLSLLPQDPEHYQTPRNELCARNHHPIDQREELYDDVAILADFTARQKGSHSKRNEEVSKCQADGDKKSWNRFVAGRKLKSNESTEGNGRIFNAIDDADEINQQLGSTRMNTFQKLISKMESSLGKASARTVPSPMLSNKLTDTQ